MMLYKISRLFLGLLFSVNLSAEQFISLNLCSDRLLLELAEPEQIAALSPYSKKPLMMLDKVNHTKPTVEAELSALLPYADKTILLNPDFYPQLTERLTQLGFKWIALDTPNSPEQLFEQIQQLGELTQNQSKAQRLVERLKKPHFDVNQVLAETLILSETGIVEADFQPYSTLLNLLGLSPLSYPLTTQNFSLEKLLLAQPQQVILLADHQSYNEQAELLRHPILQKIKQNQPLVTMPMKYTYCLDHGVWQGAAILYNQLKSNNQAKENEQNSQN